MNDLRALAIGLDRWVAKAEAVVIVVLVAMLTAVTFAQVCARYVLGDPLIWSEEAARYLFVWVSMIGAALALREGGHFGLFLLILLKTGIDETNLASRQFAMTFPMRMQWAYLALPTGAGLMLFHLAIHFIRSPSMHILEREPE
jgi:TRAP-type C4-dicarboxylate transport system permease small subunit